MWTFTGNDTADYEKAKRLEWLVSNGIGGYASSTIIGCNTRGYHGLLVAAANPPHERNILLSKVEEEVQIDGVSHFLSVNRYDEILHPEGHHLLRRFTFSTHPCFTYEVGGATIEKTIDTVQGENTTIIQYAFEGRFKEAMLRVRPLVNLRGFHVRTKEEGHPGFSQTGDGSIVRIDTASCSASLYLSAGNARYEENSLWYRRFTYDLEIERGYEPHEDLFSPGEFVVSIRPGDGFIMKASDHPPPYSTTAKRCTPEKNESKESASMNIQGKLLKALSAAARTFIAGDSSGKDTYIIAGYHWFGNWSRDAMVSLPGITLTQGLFREAQRILLTHGALEKDGLLPNFLPDDKGDPDYGAVDAPLWFVNALYLCHSAHKDRVFLKKLYPVAESIIRHYSEGTRFGIHMDSDGLIEAGSANRALTWMDAVVEGSPVVLRQGKVVEINALWYNALKVMEQMSRELGENADSYSTTAHKAKASFNLKFWNNDCGCLYDYVGEEEPDPSVRPNQLFALSLPFPVLSPCLWQLTFQRVEAGLYTPLGLKTLSPRDPKYMGTYGGGLRERDTAYHQGTVWPWLLGAYFDAKARVEGALSPEDFELRQSAQAIYRHLSEAGIGTVSEVFDGDPPHNPGGCISQAWSVAETLRVFHRYLIK